MSAPSGPAVLFVGVDHRRLALDALERLHGARRNGAVDAELRGMCAGHVGLATCHRLELYVEAPTVAAAELFRRWIGIELGEVPGSELRVAAGVDAGRHLLRVAAGLESAVLGEDQVLGQVRAAYRDACRTSRPGPLLHRLFHAAFRAGKRVRRETALARGGRSLAGVAVNEVERELGGLGCRTVLLLGAGEMAAVAARRLRDRGVGRLLIANRTRERARALASEHRGEALPWSWRLRAFAEADAVVCATGADAAVVPAAAWSVAEPPHVVVDLAMPRNVEAPAGGEAGARLVDLDELSHRLAADEAKRRGAVLEAESIVETELGEWRSWVESRRVAGVGCRLGERVAG